eukprot:COSAG02_NODE_63564_length_263_cov_0.554878_1_plen_32_part_01
MPWGVVWKGVGHEVHLKSRAASALFGVARNVA